MAPSQLPLLLTAVTTLATAVGALAACAQAVYARTTAQRLATKRDAESSGMQLRAVTPAAESSERTPLNGRQNSLLDHFMECLRSEHAAFALVGEMRRTGGDAVTASANLRAAEKRNRKLAEYALLSLAYAALCGLAPPASPALKS